MTEETKYESAAFPLCNLVIHVLNLCQMEDGHTIFDYNVGLNDIVQLLVRQKLPVNDVAKSKDKEAELSDSDSGCGSTQSESDKSSTHGEVEGQTAGTSAQINTQELIDPGFGFFKVCFTACNLDLMILFSGYRLWGSSTSNISVRDGLLTAVIYDLEPERLLYHSSYTRQGSSVNQCQSDTIYCQHPKIFLIPLEMFYLRQL